jgi:predicted Holliday junction resolvase-like endonuclease
VSTEFFKKLSVLHEVMKEYAKGRRASDADQSYLRARRRMLMDEVIIPEFHVLDGVNINVALGDVYATQIAAAVEKYPHVRHFYGKAVYGSVLEDLRALGIEVRQKITTASPAGQRIARRHREATKRRNYLLHMIIIPEFGVKDNGSLVKPSEAPLKGVFEALKKYPDVLNLYPKHVYMTVWNDLRALGIKSTDKYTTIRATWQQKFRENPELGEEMRKTGLARIKNARKKVKKSTLRDNVRKARDAIKEKIDERRAALLDCVIIPEFGTYGEGKAPEIPTDVSIATVVKTLQKYPPILELYPKSIYGSVRRDVRALGIGITDTSVTLMYVWKEKLHENPELLAELQQRARRATKIRHRKKEKIREQRQRTLKQLVLGKFGGLHGISYEKLIEYIEKRRPQKVLEQYRGYSLANAIKQDLLALRRRERERSTPET